jgi:hypothetical protein
MPDHITDHFGTPLGGAAHVAEVDPVAAAEQKIIQAAPDVLKWLRLTGCDPDHPASKFHALAVAMGEYERLRAARDGGAR